VRKGELDEAQLVAITTCGLVICARFPGLRLQLTLGVCLAVDSGLELEVSWLVARGDRSRNVRHAGSTRF
jgi:hypothetical protein